MDIRAMMNLPEDQPDFVELISIATVIDRLSDACTPRPPKAEWFGTGPGQWDAWWITLTSGREVLMRPITCENTPTGILLLEADPMADSGQCWPLKYVASVIPVFREGYPAPVGWQVIQT